MANWFCNQTHLYGFFCGKLRERVFLIIDTSDVKETKVVKCYMFLLHRASDKRGLGPHFFANYAFKRQLIFFCLGNILPRSSKEGNNTVFFVKPIVKEKQLNTKAFGSVLT